MKVRVTKRDIELGEKGNDKTCPIAKALTRKLRKRVSVTDENIYIYNGGTLTRVLKHSIKSANFVYRFDAGTLVKPSTFTLKPV